NVANLLLSRGAARQREMSLRLAIGASRSQLAQQLLVESTLLALIGGSIGLVLALTVIRTAGPHLPSDLPRVANIGIDVRVMIFTGLISLATGVLFGMAPL